MRLRSSLITAVAVATAVSAAACSGSPSSSGSGANASATLNLALSTQPLSLDPAKNGGGGNEVFVDLAYQSLVHANADGTYAPSLAEAYGYVGAGNRQFKITLRDGVKFSDGAALDSGAVKKYLEYYVGAGGPFAANAKTIGKIDTPDAKTVVLTLNAPNPDMPYFFSEHGFFGNVISPTALAGDTARLGTTTAGAGPYMLDPAATVQGSTYTYVPNPHYYEPKSRKFKKVVVKVIANVTTAYQSLQSGQVAWTGADTSFVDKAKSSGLRTVVRPNGMSGLFIQDRAGTKVKAFGDVRVRQAINYAINRDELSKAIEGSVGQPLQQIIAPGFNGFDKAAESTYTYDVAKAKQLLADAGYPNGFSFTTLVGSFDPTTVKEAQGIAEDLKAVGITMDIDTKATFPDYARAQESGKYPSTVFTWGSSTMYAVAQQLVLPTGILNGFHSSDPELNALFDKAAALPSDQAEPVWQELSKQVTEKAWFAPVMVAHSVFVMDKGLTGSDKNLVFPNPIYFSFAK
ncbi:ABC transporter substrate-binding protein [Streptomyces sp. NPDC002491]